MFSSDLFCSYYFSMSFYLRVVIYTTFCCVSVLYLQWAKQLLSQHIYNKGMN